jgi:hypothetical protein
MSILVSLCPVALLTLTIQVSSIAPAQADDTPRSKVAALPGYHVSIFAQGTSSYFNPDSIDVAGKYVYVGYQNITAKDGTDNKTSTIVQYTRTGEVVHIFTVLGHNDGLRFNPDTHLLWATSNEDGNPRIVTINPDNGVITPYVFPPTPNGGGYDDVIFVNGKAFIAASNPNLNSAGVNVFPAVDEITLTNGQAVLTPILDGNATATDLVTNQQVTLNLTDPDSQSLDNQGNLVQDDQADAQLIFLHNPGTAQQTVTRLSIGTQVDDTLWIPATKGKLLVVDGKANTIYAVTIDGTGFTKGTVYTEAPSDSGVAGFVGTLDLATGTITPAIIGLGSPTGLAFLPEENSEEN